MSHNNSELAGQLEPTSLVSDVLPMVEPQTSVGETQRASALYMLEKLDQETATMRQQILDRAGSSIISRQRAAKLFEAAESRDASGMQQFGLHADRAWLEEVMQCIVEGRPVTVEASHFVAARYMDEDGDCKLADPTPRSDCAWSFATMLKKVMPPDASNITYISVAEHGRDPAYDSLLTLEERTEYVARVRLFLQKQGLLSESATPEASGLLVANDERAVNHFIERLSGTKEGRIREGRFGLTAFAPSSQLLDRLPRPIADSLYGRPAANSMQELTVNLLLGDHCSKPLAYASSLAKVLEEGGAHLAITDYSVMAQVEGYVLLRAAGLVHEEDYHAVGVGEYCSPLEFVYIMGEFLKRTVVDFLADLDRYTPFSDFDPSGYVGSNYAGETILQDDQRIIKLAMFVLKALDVRASHAADIGCGPNLYPSMMMLPFIDAQGTLDLIDFSPPNLEYMHDFFSGNLATEDAEVWTKFEEFMIAHGGNIYKGVIQWLQNAFQREKVTLNRGSILEPSGRKYDLGTSFFVIDSISKLLIDSRKCVGTFREWLASEGLFIGGFMLNDKGSEHRGYTTGVLGFFPNVSQDVEDIRQAFKDNDMHCIVVPTSSAERARDGYHGMAVAFACHERSQMARRLKRLEQEIMAHAKKIERETVEG